MIGVIILITALAVGAVGLRHVVRVPEQQALAGLFGEPERERVVQARSAATIALAEAYLRLSRLGDALRAEAWQGVPFTIRRRSAQWAEWAFADGHVWLVRHRGRCPKSMRRLIVSGARPTAQGLVVGAYGPGGGRAEGVLLLQDVLDAGS